MRYLKYQKWLEFVAMALFATVLVYFIVTGVMSCTGLDGGWPYPRH